MQHKKLRADHSNWRQQKRHCWRSQQFSSRFRVESMDRAINHLKVANQSGATSTWIFGIPSFTQSDFTLTEYNIICLKYLECLLRITLQEFDNKLFLTKFGWLVINCYKMLIAEFCFDAQACIWGILGSVAEKMPNLGLHIFK